MFGGWPRGNTPCDVLVHHSGLLSTLEPGPGRWGPDIFPCDFLVLLGFLSPHSLRLTNPDLDHIDTLGIPR